MIFKISICNKQISSQKLYTDKIFNSSGLNIVSLKKLPEIDTISFGNKSDNNNEFYNEFINEYNKQYPNTSLEETVKNIITTRPELNHGAFKKVFDFPQMEDYVIGYFYKKSLERIPKIHKSKIVLPEYYFGQPIAMNDDNIIIMKKVKGKPHSIHINRFINNIKMHRGVTEETSREYLSKLRLIKDFPQSAYDNLAKQLIYINANSDAIDMNPNNLLVDSENKEFNLVDMVDTINLKDLYSNYMSPKMATIRANIRRLLNISRNADIFWVMYSFVLTAGFQPHFLDKLNDEEQKETIEISTDVIKKCKQALKNCNYPEKRTISLIIKLLLLVNNKMLREKLFRHDEFLKLYNLN